MVPVVGVGVRAIPISGWDGRCLDCLGAEGVAAGQAAVVVQEGVVYRFSEGGADFAAQGAAKDGAEYGAGDEAEQGTCRGQFAAEVFCGLNAFEGAGGAAGGAGQDAEGAAGFLSPVPGADLVELALGTGAEGQMGLSFEGVEEGHVVCREVCSLMACLLACST